MECPHLSVSLTATVAGVLTAVWQWKNRRSVLLLPFELPFELGGIAPHHRFTSSPFNNVRRCAYATTRKQSISATLILAGS